MTMAMNNDVTMLLAMNYNAMPRGHILQAAPRLQAPFRRHPPLHSEAIMATYHGNQL